MTEPTHLSDTPRIYVACLAAYNNGILHGCWIDLDESRDGVWKHVQQMLKSSPLPAAEEWAIHDYEGFFNLRLSEYVGIDAAYHIAQFILEHGQLGAAVLDACDQELAPAETMLEDNYRGCYDSIEAFAEELLTEITDIPVHLESYIEYTAYARDLQLGGEIITVETAWDEVHIFWTR